MSASPAGAEDDEQVNFEWDDTFDDEFARMTMFVHNTGGQPVRGQCWVGSLKWLLRLKLPSLSCSFTLVLHH